MCIRDRMKPLCHSWGFCFSDHTLMDSACQVLPGSEKVKPDTNYIPYWFPTHSNRYLEKWMGQGRWAVSWCFLMTRVLTNPGKNKGICPHYSIAFLSGHLFAFMTSKEDSYVLVTYEWWSSHTVELDSPMEWFSDIWTDFIVPGDKTEVTGFEFWYLWLDRAGHFVSIVDNLFCYFCCIRETFRPTHTKALVSAHSFWAFHTQ